MNSVVIACLVDSIYNASVGLIFWKTEETIEVLPELRGPSSMMTRFLLSLKVPFAPDSRSAASILARIGECARNRDCCNFHEDTFLNSLAILEALPVSHLALSVLSIFVYAVILAQHSIRVRFRAMLH